MRLKCMPRKAILGKNNILRDTLGAPLKIWQEVVQITFLDLKIKWKEKKWIEMGRKVVIKIKGLHRLGWQICCWFWWDLPSCYNPWHIWCSKNATVFSKAFFPKDVLLEKIHHLMDTWRTVFQQYLVVAKQSRVIGWCNPPPLFVKINMLMLVLWGILGYRFRGVSSYQCWYVDNWFLWACYSCR